MTYLWNWTAFFTAGNRPAFRICPQDEPYGSVMQKLATLSFEQGLRVIASSVTQFDEKTWMELCATQEELTVKSDSIHVWLTVGQIILDLEYEVGNILRQHDMAYIVGCIVNLLFGSDELEQFALIACLYNRSDSDLKAQMVFDYLLRHYDFGAQKMQQLRTFFLELTARQREIAVLAGYGKTNKEIAQELNISQASVAEHLTSIYKNLLSVLEISTNQHGARYRLIHNLTCLFEHHPDLVIVREEH